MDLTSYLLGKNSSGGGGGGGDLSEYFNTEITSNTSTSNAYNEITIVKTTPPFIVDENVTDLSYCFYNCKLNSINVSQMNTSNITNMKSMFYQCISVSKLDIENWNVSNVTNFSMMFGYCGKLKKIDLSKWTINTNYTINTANMFNSCSELAVLDISCFDSLGSNALTYVGFACLQSDGAYADGIPYIYVKNATMQTNILNGNYGAPNTWTTANVIVKQ